MQEEDSDFLLEHDASQALLELEINANVAHSAEGATATHSTYDVEEEGYEYGDPVNAQYSAQSDLLSSSGPPEMIEQVHGNSGHQPATDQLLRIASHAEDANSYMRSAQEELEFAKLNASQLLTSLEELLGDISEPGAELTDGTALAMQQLAENAAANLEALHRINSTVEAMSSVHASITQLCQILSVPPSTIDSQGKGQPAAAAPVAPAAQPEFQRKMRVTTGSEQSRQLRILRQSTNEIEHELALLTEAAKDQLKQAHEENLAARATVQSFISALEQESDLDYLSSMANQAVHMLEAQEQTIKDILMGNHLAPQFRSTVDSVPPSDLSDVMSEQSYGRAQSSQAKASPDGRKTSWIPSGPGDLSLSLDSSDGQEHDAEDSPHSMGSGLLSTAQLTHYENPVFTNTSDAHTQVEYVNNALASKTVSAAGAHPTRVTRTTRHSDGPVLEESPESPAPDRSLQPVSSFGASEEPHAQSSHASLGGADNPLPPARVLPPGPPGLRLKPEDAATDMEHMRLSLASTDLAFCRSSILLVDKSGGVDETAAELVSKYVAELAVQRVMLQQLQEAHAGLQDEYESAVMASESLQHTKQWMSEELKSLQDELKTMRGKMAELLRARKETAEKLQQAVQARKDAESAVESAGRRGMELCEMADQEEKGRKAAEQRVVEAEAALAQLQERLNEAEAKLKSAARSQGGTVVSERSIGSPDVSSRDARKSSPKLGMLLTASADSSPPRELRARSPSGQQPEIVLVTIADSLAYGALELAVHEVHQEQGLAEDLSSAVLKQAWAAGSMKKPASTGSTPQLRVTDLLRWRPGSAQAALQQGGEAASPPAAGTRELPPMPAASDKAEGPAAAPVGKTGAAAAVPAPLTKGQASPEADPANLLKLAHQELTRSQQTYKESLKVLQTMHDEAQRFNKRLWAENSALSNQLEAAENELKDLRKLATGAQKPSLTDRAVSAGGAAQPSEQESLQAQLVSSNKQVQRLQRSLLKRNLLIERLTQQLVGVSDDIRHFEATVLRCEATTGALLSKRHAIPA